MKIVHTISYFQPKLGYQEFYLAKEQQKMGHEVCVITSDRYFPFPNFSETMGKILGTRYVGSGIFNEEGIKVVRLPTLFEYTSYNFLLGLKKSIANFGPTVVHAHNASSPITLATIALKDVLDYKVIVDCHMDYSLRSKSKIHSALFHLWSRNPICRWLLRRADGYIAVAESSRNWLSREWGISNNRIEMIPLGADTNLFSPNNSTRKLMRKKLKITDEEIAIIYAGKLHPKKEIEVLLQASALLIKNNKKIKVIVVGNGSKEYVTELVNLIHKYKIQDYILLLPLQHKTKLPDFYNAADIGVWPGNPSITIIEAMSTGMPIIIPHSDSSTDLSHYVENNNGYLFTRGDYIELYYMIEKLILDERLRKNMSKRSRIHVVKNLSWESLSKKTISYYMNSRD